MNLRISIVIIVFPLFSCVFAKDQREYQHGIDFIKRENGLYWLIWSSSGNPPTGDDPRGNWTHDIYYSEIDPANPQINPTVIISRPEAQEPASSAVTENGNIMITMEDGWNVLNVIGQRYGVYDNNLNDIKPYPCMVLDGGHSGHVAAVENLFVIFFSEGWVEGGGVDDLGSGDDVMLSVYNSQGNFQRRSNVSVGDADRDWWPMAAGSDSTVLLLWQRFVNGQEYANLMYTIYNPATGQYLLENTMLAQAIKYYTYDVQYIPAIERFLILGGYYSGGGFAYLLNTNGHIITGDMTLPPIVREAQPAIKQENSLAYAVYPAYPNKIATILLSDSEITLNNILSGDHLWSYTGTDGIFINDNSVYFVNLSPHGCHEIFFDSVIAVSSLSSVPARQIPTDFILSSNFPNPFNLQTVINYQIHHSGFVHLGVYNLMGELVSTLVNVHQSAGSYCVKFTAGVLPAGIYFYALKTEKGHQVRKMILLP